MTVTPIPFPYPFTPMANITGMTYADGTTYLAALEQLKDFINTTLINQTNDLFADAAAQYAAGITNSEAAMTSFIANFTDELKTINTNAVDGMVTDTANPVHTHIQGLIDATATALTTTVEAYTDGKITDLDTALRTVITDLDTRLSAVITGLDTRLSADITALQTRGAQNGYAVATFLADGVDGEKLSLFYSPDGKTVTGGSGNPAYTPTDGQGVRDPSLITWNGSWFVAYTSNNGADKDFQVASSPSGAPGTWALSSTVNAANLPDTSRIWAPEIVTAPDGVYIFFTRIRTDGTTGSMYWVKATNDQLTAWTAPTPLAWTVEPGHYIDGVPVQGPDGAWYLFYSTGTDIERATATTITGTWTRDRTGNWAGYGTGIEGPYLTKDGNTYRIYFDRYQAGTGIAWAESTDLNTWTPAQPVTVVPGTLRAGQAIRHGSFYKLPDPASNNEALAGQLRGNRVRHIELTSTPGVTGGFGVVVTVTGWTVDTNETTDQSFVSYDPATGYLTFNEYGVYAFGANVGANGVTGVNRSFAQLQSVDGPATTHLRTAGGAEDVFSLAVPNFKTNHVGERVQVQVFTTWTGTETAATYPVRLRITKIA